jgi:polysaccharide deacetylase family protein (PEP-CTERM system associated)
LSSLLLSIDLEDVRDWVKDGSTYSERVPDNTKAYLAFFKKNDLKATFFVVGEVARRYPWLISEISDAGHELACHGNIHIQLDKLSPKEFRIDLQKNIKALKDSGAFDIKGFRAPTFSLTDKTKWAYEVLADLGFSYSSSVLPAKNPLYGWREFGKVPKKISKNLWEIPVTLHRVGWLSIPVAGGVYFRVLPFSYSKWKIGQILSMAKPVVTYFHPYDIDLKQERFMHPDLGQNKFLNMLMYLGRRKLLDRLEILQKSFSTETFIQFVNRLDEKG